MFLTVAEAALCHGAVGAAGHAEQVDTKQRLYPAGSSILWSFLLRRCLRSQLAVRRREEERVEERSGPGRVSWEMRKVWSDAYPVVSLGA
ncbi:uncharacterized protein VSU04_001631 isoform 3-T3 [Chlamydotis macqueenii]